MFRIDLKGHSGLNELCLATDFCAALLAYNSGAASFFMPLLESLFRAAKRFMGREVFSDTSFANEESVLYGFAKALRLQEKPSDNCWAVDIGASDGIDQSSIKKFAYSLRWNACLIEYDSQKFARLSSLYATHASASLVKAKVTPENISSMLKACDVPLRFDILNLDIDSWDLSVIQALLVEGFRPALLTMEINEKIPSGIIFSVSYRPEHVWKGDHFYGCSISAACEVMKCFGYYLVGVEWNNAFFARQDLCDSFAIPDFSAAEALSIGYTSRQNRIDVFPWNSEVDYWHSLPAAQALEAVRQYFSEYELSKYELRLAE